MSWTQPLCIRCWNRDNPDRQVQNDHAMGDPKRCCKCGTNTRAGIFIRIDPDTVPFPAPDIGGEIFTVPWESVEAVLWSKAEFDGTAFNRDADGTTVVYSYSRWALNLFFLALADAMGPIVSPDLEGFPQIYHTLAELTMDMSTPVPEPDHGPECFSCRLPNIRILPLNASKE